MRETERRRPFYYGVQGYQAGEGAPAFHKGRTGCIVIEGDGRSLPMLGDGTVDCIITDHPWLDPLSNRGGNRSFAEYECFRYGKEDFEEKARLLKEGAFLAEFLPEENANNYEALYGIKEMAKECGLMYYCKVGWKKGKLINNTGRKAKNGEDIMIFSKGKARSLREDVKKSRKEGHPCYMSGTAGMLPAVFDVEPVPLKERRHPGELPEKLCRQLLEFLTKEGEVVLDQFAGSGSVGAAALRCKRSCILVEKEHGYIEVMKKRLEAICLPCIPQGTGKGEPGRNKAAG